MSLINCPSCQQKISNKVSQCPQCGFSFDQNEDEIEHLRKVNYRNYRDKMYRFKMLSFVAIAIALFGTVPMLWIYARAIDYGFVPSLISHWGIYLLVAGFAMYVIVRVMMVNTRRNYQASKSR
jgi:uncharacterized membrane protein